MKNAAVICHARFLDLAAFAETLQVCGYAIRYYDAGYDAFTFDPVDTDIVVVLGGPIGAYELEDYPFIADEMAILRARVAADRPTLAICLGAQILAQALGARVYADTTEIGWEPVELTEAGERSVLHDIGRDAVPLLHWHGDTFDLPDRATRLASTPGCARSPGCHSGCAVSSRGWRATFRTLADLQRETERAHEESHCVQPARAGDGLASIGQIEGTPESFAKDRDAVAVMIETAGDAGKPFIFTSGSAIFAVFTKGEASPTIFDEDHPVPLPASVFATPMAEIPQPLIDGFGGSMAPRAETEKAVLNAVGVRGIVIRPGLVYGEGRGYDLPNLIALTKTHGAAPHLGTGGVRQGYVHLDDLVEVYALALERAPAGTMLHGVTDEIALGDLAVAVSRLVGAKRPNRVLVTSGDVHARWRPRREPVGE